MDLQCPSFQVLFTFLLRTVILLLKIGKRGYNNNSSALKLPPGPWKLPIIGNIHQLIGALPHRVLRDLAKQHGHLMHLKLGEVSTVVVSSAKFAKEVIKTHDIIFASRPQVIATRIVFCDSEDIAFAPYGEYWRELRKICTQELLSAKRVQSYRRPIREKEGSGLKRVELWGGSSNDADIRGFGLFDKVRLIEQSNAKHLPITSKAYSSLRAFKRGDLWCSAHFVLKKCQSERIYGRPIS